LDGIDFGGYLDVEFGKNGEWDVDGMRWTSPNPKSYFSKLGEVNGDKGFECKIMPYSFTLNFLIFTCG
jgi:hypothetical protein